MPDAVPGPVHLGVVPQGRTAGDEIAALDQHVRRGEAQAVAAGRVNGEETHVGLLAPDGIHRQDGLLEQDQLDFEVQFASECTGQVDRDAARLAGGRIGVRQDRVTQIDGSAKPATGRERAGNSCGGERHAGESSDAIGQAR